jgi:hypothetical protein
MAFTRHHRALAIGQGSHHPRPFTVCAALCPRNRKALGLGAAECDALRTASVLHDIGKLAVPEPIICKPEKLTPAEFDKMKIRRWWGRKFWSGSGFRIRGADRKVVSRKMGWQPVPGRIARGGDPHWCANPRRGRLSGRIRKFGFASETQTLPSVAAFGSHSLPVLRSGRAPTTAETLQAVADRIQSAVPCDAIAFCEPQENAMAVSFAGGSYRTALENLRVPVGEGMVG